MPGYYPTAVKVFVDFVNGPVSAVSTWTDVTQWVTGRVRWEYGRSSAVDDFQPGKGQYTLVNDDSRFDPSNSAGPYYGTLKPRRRTKIVSTINAVDYVVGFGIVEGWPQRWEGRKKGYVDITFTDILGLFGQVKMPDSVWDWRVEQTGPYLWYKLGDTSTPYASDSSPSALGGEWRVYEGGGSPLFGQFTPKAVLESARTGSVIPSVERQSVSWASMQADVGQPLGGIAGVPRTPVFVPSWETQNLILGDFGVVLWVLPRQAFPVDIRNVYYSTTPMEQPLVSWGQRGAHSWQLYLGTDGKLGWWFTNGANSWGQTAIGPSLMDGLPHMVGARRVGNTIRTYVDGSLAMFGGFGAIDVTTVLPAPISPAYIGGTDNYGLMGLQSIIGDVVFYASGGLTETELNLLWYAGKYGSVFGTTSIDTDSAFDQGFHLTGLTAQTRLLAFSDGQVVTETISGQSFQEYLRKLAATEQGLLFAERDGGIRFYGRDWPNRADSKTVQYTLGDQLGATVGFADLGYRDPADELQNDVTVTHPGGSERSTNTTSVTDYGPVSGSVDTFLASQAVAKQVANLRVWMYGTPPVDGVIPDRLVIQPNTQDEFLMCCDLLIADRLQITRTRPNGTALVDDYWVESVGHEFTAEVGGEWTTTVGLTLADHPAKPFVIDTSTLDSSDVLWI